MIKAAANHYITNCDPPDTSRLRKSSASEELDAIYRARFNIEEYILYRRREIQYITRYIDFIRNKNIILHILNKKCKIYTSENSSELLDKYLLPYNENSTINSRQIIKSSLGVDDEITTNLYHDYHHCNASNYEMICLYLNIICNNKTFDCMTIEYATRPFLANPLVEIGGVDNIYYLYNNSEKLYLNYLYYLIDL